MAFDIEMAVRFRNALADSGKIEEKQMFGALGFMVNSKLAVAVGKDDVMFKVGPELTREKLASGQAKPVSMNNRTMKSWVVIENDILRSAEHFDEWLSTATTYNGSTP